MTRSASPILISPVSFVLGRFVHSLLLLAKAYKDRHEVRNLAEFDERMLKDIGLTRADVESALSEPLHQLPSWVLVRCTEPSALAHGPAAACQSRPVVPLVTRS